MAGPTTTELLWGVPQAPRRGPKPSLTLDQIVAEAIALADAEGIANLSMARLAERLGCAKMALYRYLPGKNELTALMLDTALGTPPVATATPGDATEPWRACLSDWATTIFDLYSAHPWAGELTASTVRPIGPNEMGWMEAALGALSESTLTAAERLDSVVLLLGHARSLAQQVGGAGAQDDLEGQLAKEVGAALTAHGDRYPHVLAAFAEQGNGPADDNGRNNALHFGIERILDGLSAYMATKK